MIVFFGSNAGSLSDRVTSPAVALQESCLSLLWNTTWNTTVRNEYYWMSSFTHCSISTRIIVTFVNTKSNRVRYATRLALATNYGLITSEWRPDSTLTPNNDHESLSANHVYHKVVLSKTHLPLTTEKGSLRLLTSVGHAVKLIVIVIYRCRSVQTFVNSLPSLYRVWGMLQLHRGLTSNAAVDQCRSHTSYKQGSFSFLTGGTTP
jgi:hypothetical protein